MCTNNLCFEQKYENNKKKSTENCFFFYSPKISQYITRACHRNVIKSVINFIDESSRLPSEMPLLSILWRNWSCNETLY